MIVGNSGGPYNTFKGAADVHDADVHNIMVNKVLHFHTATTTTLAVETTGDGTEYQITIDDPTGFAIGNALHIENGAQEPTHSKITAIAGSVFDLDRRIDLAHPIGAEVTKSVNDVNSIVGTLATPIIYWAGPVPGEIWHIERALLAMAHDTAGDLGKFGNLAALANGAIIRIRTNGTYRTLSNWKNSGDMKTDMYDVDFPPRSGGGGNYGTTGRWTFKKAGIVIELNGDTDDRFEMLVQDDITDSALGFFNMKIQGHLNNA